MWLKNKGKRSTLKRVDFKKRVDAAHEKEEKICVLWNETVISEDNVLELICSDKYETDNRLIVTTPDRADNLAENLWEWESAK